MNVLLVCVNYNSNNEMFLFLHSLEKALNYGFAGLDLNSKLEKSKGIKDVELINKTFKLINNY